MLLETVYQKAILPVYRFTVLPFVHVFRFQHRSQAKAHYLSMKYQRQKELFSKNTWRECFRKRQMYQTMAGIHFHHYNKCK